MYAVARSYAGKTDLIAGMREHEESVKSAMKDVPGFRAYYIVSTSDGGAVSFTVCDDEAGAEASTRAAAAWIAENLQTSRSRRPWSPPARSRSASEPQQAHLEPAGPSPWPESAA